MLACARIGAIHSVVFAGFSAESLKDRIIDCSSRFVITATHGRRGGKTLPLKTIVDTAISHCWNHRVDAVFVFPYPGSDYPTTADRQPLDIHMTEVMNKARPYCPNEWNDSEDTLFILYTSGSTGKPKGVAHTTSGYLLHAAMTTHRSFNIEEGDIHGCVADAGWITGHTYIVYGPLALGATTVMFESIPTYPNCYRYWDVVQRHKLTQFYTAPTASKSFLL
jgi:acetyl-CoA synthetase